MTTEGCQFHYTSADSAFVCMLFLSAAVVVYLLRNVFVRLSHPLTQKMHFQKELDAEPAGAIHRGRCSPQPAPESSDGRSATEKGKETFSVTDCTVGSQRGDFSDTRAGSSPDNTQRRSGTPGNHGVRREFTGQLAVGRQVAPRSPINARYGTRRERSYPGFVILDDSHVNSLRFVSLSEVLQCLDSTKVFSKYGEATKLNGPYKMKAGTVNGEGTEDIYSDAFCPRNVTADSRGEATPQSHRPPSPETENRRGGSRSGPVVFRGIGSTRMTETKQRQQTGEVRAAAPSYLEKSTQQQLQRLNGRGSLEGPIGGGLVRSPGPRNNSNGWCEPGSGSCGQSRQTPPQSVVRSASTNDAVSPKHEGADDDPQQFSFPPASRENTCDEVRALDAYKHCKELDHLWSLATTPQACYAFSWLFDSKLTETDFISLKFGEMLSSNVIDVYLKILVSKSAPRGQDILHVPWFVMSNIVKGIFKYFSTKGYIHYEQFWNKDIMAYKLVLGALWDFDYWSLLVIRPEQCTLWYLNPTSESLDQMNAILVNWAAYLKLRHSDKVHATTLKWQTKTMFHLTTTDVKNSGIFTLLCADAILKNSSLVYVSPNQAGWERRRIALELFQQSESMLHRCRGCGELIEDQESVLSCACCGYRFHALVNSCKRYREPSARQNPFVCKLCESF